MEAETRQCQNCKQNFTIEAEDFRFYGKIDVPPPTFCNLCRAQRRMAFRNDRPLYKRKSDLSGETIFSTYHEDVPFPIYAQKEWYSDVWDPMDYGREYDFNRPFFEQFKELSDSVPKLGKSALDIGPGTDYCNNFDGLKNSYLVFATSGSEDCMYCTYLNKCRGCVDDILLEQCELCFESMNLGNCSKTFYSYINSQCVDTWFTRNSKGLTNCFACTNLRKKSHYIFNEPYTKAAYLEKLKELGFDSGSYASTRSMLERVREHWIRYPLKYITDGTKSVDVTGEYIFHSKDVKQCYQIMSAEHLRYCQFLSFGGAKDCYDISVYGANTELSYESAMVGEQASGIKFCLQSWRNLRNIEYCEYVQSVSDCFGCVSLRNKQYCVFNKQYTKEEYETLVAKIKQHMNDMPYVDKKGRVYRYGEFFPIEFSPYGYNETIAQEHFELTKEETVNEGYKWRDVADREYKPTLMAEDLPDHINDVDESILDEIIGCIHEGECNQNCTIAFRLIPEELRFYKRFRLPLPRLCVNCRHAERRKQRNSFVLSKRKCMCMGRQSENQRYVNISDSHRSHEPDKSCPNEFETSYSPEGGEIVYCEQCYQAEVV